MQDKTFDVNIRGMYKSFFDEHSICGALDLCLNDGYTPMFMPEIIRARLQLDDTCDIWRNSYTALSVIGQGKSKRGKDVVVFAHDYNYLCDIENIEMSIRRGLFGGAAAVPVVHLHSLLELEDQDRVFVLDYYKFVNSYVGLMQTKKAQNHIQAVPFMGVTKEEAGEYVQRYKKIFGSHIGVIHAIDETPCDDVALFRFLCLDSPDYRGLDARRSLFSGARFLGAVPKIRRQREAVLSQLERNVLDCVNSKKSFTHDGTVWAPIDQKSGLYLLEKK